MGCRVEMNGQDPGKPKEERGGSEPLPHPPQLPGLAGASCPSLTPLPPPLLSNSPILTPVVLLMVPKSLHGAKANHSFYPLFTDRRQPTPSLKPRPPDPLVFLLPPCHQYLRFSHLLSCYLGSFPGLGGDWSCSGSNLGALPFSRAPCFGNFICSFAFINSSVPKAPLSSIPSPPLL